MTSRAGRGARGGTSSGRLPFVNGGPAYRLGMYGEEGETQSPAITGRFSNVYYCMS